MNNNENTPVIKSHALYIHVPFCASRCVYCDFFSSTNVKELEKSYISALCRELASRASEAGVLETIYLGGGTPSLLSKKSLIQLFETIYRHYTVKLNAEITMECNPDDVSVEFVQTIKALGVNRISFGVQTFDDAQLRFLRRRHNAQQAVNAIKVVTDILTDNISLDLIYALPNQSLNDWSNNLEKAFTLPITHLSAYALSYEKGTALWQMRAQGKVREVAEYSTEQMYNMLLDYTDNKGFEHYEISNFSRPNYRSRHNSMYWTGVPYIGCGAGAHSYDGLRTRRFNKGNLSSYISGSSFFEEEYLSDADLYNELLFTRLRTKEGLDVNAISQAFSSYFKEQIADYLKRGYLIKMNNRIFLSKTAIFISDTIISDLMWVE